MNAGKAAACALLSPQPLLDQFQDNVAVKMSSPVMCEAGNAGLSGVPIALVLDIQVVGLLGEAMQRVTEDGNALPRLDAAKLNMLFINTLVGRVQCRSRAHV